MTTPSRAALDDWAKRFLANRKIVNPSTRTPQLSTNTNEADCIERQMNEDGHTIWGWRKYRCTYASEEQWTTFMQRFWCHIDDSLQHFNALDMKSSLDMPVIEDPSLDGASPARVYKLFKQWSDVAQQEEQPSTFSPLAQRYRFCLHVDQAGVESVLQGPPAPDDFNHDAYVNIIFVPYSYDDDVDTANEHEFTTRIRYSCLIPRAYNICRSLQGAWDYIARPPPHVANP